MPQEMDNQWVDMKEDILAGEIPDAPNALFGLLVKMVHELVEDKEHTQMSFYSSRFANTLSFRL